MLLKRQDKPGPRKEVFVRTYKNLRISQSCMSAAPPRYLESPGFAFVKEFYSRGLAPVGRNSALSGISSRVGISCQQPSNQQSADIIGLPVCVSVSVCV